jgi:hypothetical protein
MAVAKEHLDRDDLTIFNRAERIRASLSEAFDVAAVRFVKIDEAAARLNAAAQPVIEVKLLAVRRIERSQIEPLTKLELALVLELDQQLNNALHRSPREDRHPSGSGL